ncbi:MAG: B12-binding domain-containing radical SAM protein [Alphaproteobacteria bacterium]|nr:B12-binding domain-containing radical SAM protein [Alphaproteobacteria bacterium]
MKTRVQVRSRRRILCVSPRYAPSFGTFQYAYELTDGVRAFMPPQGILLIAAYLPAMWEVRVVDENIAAATDADFAWADAVFVSGMHVQKAEIAGVALRARQAGKASVLGGPSVSACPEDYPQFDYLHLGELGDATDTLIEILDDDPSPLPAQRRLQTNERLPLRDFPIPAYERMQGRRYFLGNIQFSSGCPYQCEFCDIPGLYGRQPRLKDPVQITAELDAMLAAGISGAVYFVDDNFIGNKKAARQLLPHLIAWQKLRAYPLQFSCEATLNIATCPDILAMMREACFYAVFCGIETPELGALDAMRKSHNRVMPLLDAVNTINSFGIEVVSGIILGLDTDTAATAANLIDFIDRSRIPLLTINLLQALPKTPLWDRLAAAGRLNHDPERESNVVFLRSYRDVLDSWQEAIGHAYTPEAIFERLHWNLRHTYVHRFDPPVTRARLNAANLRRAAVILGKLFVKVGLFSGYRRQFWRFAAESLRAGRVGDFIAVCLVAHHLIRFARDCTEGRQNASFYADRAKLPAAREVAA